MPSAEKLQSNRIYLDLHALFDDIEPEKMIHLLAAIWLGRGDYSSEEWQTALEKAKSYPIDLIPEYIITLPEAYLFLIYGLKKIMKYEKCHESLENK